MLTNPSLQQLRSYIDSQEYRAHDAQEPSRHPFVTISRQMGSGAFTVGQKLCEILNGRAHRAPHTWMWFDRDLARRAAEEHRLSPESKARLNESGHNSLLAWFDDAFSSSPSWTSLVRRVGQTVVQLARIGCVIIVGRGGNILTRAMPYGLHVRLVGSHDKRVTQIQRYFGLTRNEATQLIEREDQGRERYIKQYFDRDIQNPLDYDVSINTDHISHDDVALWIADEVMRIRARTPAPSPVERQHTAHVR